MGGAISTLFLQRHPGVCDAIALTAPMFGIVIRMPSFMARQQNSEPNRASVPTLQSPFLMRVNSELNLEFCWRKTLILRIIRKNR